MDLKEFVEEGKKLYNEATKGPWGWQSFGDYCLIEQHGRRHVVLAASSEGKLVQRDAETGLLVDFEPGHPNSKFLAESRDILPLALRMLERVQERVRQGVLRGHMKIMDIQILRDELDRMAVEAK